MKAAVRIVQSHVTSPLGLGTAQTWAAYRAGLSRFVFSSEFGTGLESIKMSLFPEDILPDEQDWPPGTIYFEQRLLRLSVDSLLGAIDGVHLEQPAPLFLCLPPDHVEPQRMLSALDNYAEGRVAIGASRALPLGRAAGFEALTQAITYLKAGKGAYAIVGGVDSHLEARRLSALHLAGRLRSSGPSNGFIPGEGASFVLLTNQSAPQGDRSTVVAAVGTAEGTSHVDEAQTHLGEELSQSVEAMRADLPESTGPAQVIFTAMNAEPIWTKEWAVARLRHKDIIAADGMIEHPNMRIGDMGAATVPLLLAVADLALQNGHRDGPALLLASSDQGLRGSAWLEPGEAVERF
jgi:3-oxoacyl-[acyl-carrier-protein] synthase I